MKKYKVNVNGTDYEIVLEVINETECHTPVTLTPNSISSPTPTSTPTSTPAATSRSYPIKSPMPGNILSLHITPGKPVKKGEVLMILEAMKMENEILSPCDGQVTTIHVTQGTTVESGSLLCVIE
ncbi:MAG: acetyl-CoA carboxylase biotin carboxyl carrier protein subunit [Zhenhengia sp.]